jgi:putative glutamine amidotransferase
MAAMRVLLAHGAKKPVEPYLKALRGAGLEPVESTPEKPGDLAGCLGLVLAGGSDIEPARYGQPNLAAKSPVPERDLLELSQVEEALQSGKPVLGICRGLQLLNVYYGGTLHQDIGEDHSLTRHGVRFAPSSKLASIARPETVNSRHHQAIDRLGKGLQISAWSAGDNIIEGVEDPSRPFVVAVQWHPEDLANEGDEEARALFAAFAAALR